MLQRLQNAGLRLKDSKCEFLVASVTYLGYQIDAKGLHPINEKIKAIQDAPEPRNVTELKSYLGLLSYYSRFLPHMSSNLAPLNQWTLFIIRLRLLFYFVFRTHSICFCNIYRLQMALGV